MFNQLTDAQSERLYLLLEELGEAQQVIGKILRHGYESSYPGETETNRQSLEREVGDVFHALELMDKQEDINSHNILEYASVKQDKPNKYFHHQ